VWKLRKLARFFFKSYAHSIARSLYRAREEKNKAAHELAKAQQKVNELSDDMKSVDSHYSVDVPALESGLIEELARIESMHDQKLEAVRSLKFRAEFFAQIEKLCSQFSEDVLACSEQKKQELLAQSIHLLDTVTEKLIT
jgi:hypothetical protein